MSATKWYEKQNKQPDVVVSSRIRLARNCKEFPFPCRMSPDDRRQLADNVGSALKTGNFSGSLAFSRVDMGALTDEQALAYVEQHSISPDFAQNRDGKTLYVTADGSVSIMVGEEDHLRIQILGANECLREEMQLAEQLDNLLDEQLHFAFDEKLGYLTQCPTNLGTGLRASVMLSLPALEATGALQKLAGSVQKLGLALRGTFGEGSNPKGSLYQLSNQVTLGISEENAIENLSGIAGQLVEQERRARNALLEQTNLEDQIWRAYGACRYARAMTMEEFRQYASLLRVGVGLEYFGGLTAATLDTLLSTVGAGGLMTEAGRELEPGERDRMRAERVRKALEEAERSAQ
jgi:protein arginine kinase